MAETEKEKSRLEKLEEKKQQLENQIKTIKQREKQEERKRRTRRLIEVGALSDKYFDSSDLTPEEYKLFLDKLIVLPQVKDLVNKHK